MRTPSHTTNALTANHKINAVAGITVQGNRYEFNGTAANTLPYESLGLSGLGYGNLQPVMSRIIGVGAGIGFGARKLYV